MPSISPELFLCCFMAITTLINIVATGSNSWASLDYCSSGQCVSSYYGLFVYCVSQSVYSTNCGSYPSGQGAWLGACQFFAVISCLLAILTCFYMFLAAADVRMPCPLPEAKISLIVTVILGVITFCSLLSFAIFAGKGLRSDSGFNFSWGFGLMIVSFLFFATTTAFYFLFKVRGVLRSTTQETAA